MSLVNAPSFEDLSAYDVNVVGKYEVNRQTLYDTVVYTGATGQTSLSFFQNPIGQQISAGVFKTVQDTNMTSAGMMPAPVNFLIESVELMFIPGSNPFALNADAAEYFNDVFTFKSNGSLRLGIGDKAQLTEAPLGVFPPKTTLDVSSSIGGNTTQNFVWADLVGRPYYLDVPLLLRPNQNFDVRLDWKIPLPLPSGLNGRIICKLDGLRYRLAQ